MVSKVKPGAGGTVTQTGFVLTVVPHGLVEDNVTLYTPAMA